MPFLDRQLEMKRSLDARMALRDLPGSDSSLTVLYIHGLGESALCFEHVMADPRLKRWPQLAVDLEGYGKSLWAKTPLSFEEQADRLAQLIERRGLEAVIGVGHSMGGVVGTFLCERSSSVRGFFNVEGNISFGDCGYSRRAAGYSLEAWLDRGLDDVLEVIYTDQDENAAVNRAYGASIQMGDPRAFHRDSEELVALSKSETLAKTLAAAAARTVYLHGAPRGTGERSLALLAEAGIETIAIQDAGHWPFLDQHDAFVDALADFLNRFE